ncbi:MAG: hypothetical protein ACYS26_05035 [Planctomycetota bacterium]|jgi:hypothetical protein
MTPALSKDIPDDPANGDSGLIGLAVGISVSDPWEFVTRRGDGLLPGRIHQISGKQALVRLDESIVIDATGPEFSWLLASPRHEGERIQGLSGSSDAIPFNFIGVADDKISSQSFPDLRGWGGRWMLIGSIRRIADEPREA